MNNYIYSLVDLQKLLVCHLEIWPTVKAMNPDVDLQDTHIVYNKRNAPHAVYIYFPNLRRVHTVRFFVCDCDLFTCDFMKLFTRCDGCDLLCIHIGIAHRNHTE